MPNNLETICIASKYIPLLDNLEIKVIGSGCYDKNKNYYPSNWIKDNSLENISNKNHHFGTLTSHYWIWKNLLDNVDESKWIAICHYRRFWVKEGFENKTNEKNLKENLLKNVSKEFDEYDVLLPPQINLMNTKRIKVLKKGFKNLIKDPLILFNKKKYTINLHFDLFHGYKFLERSIKVMSTEDQKDFDYYTKTSNTFHPFQIFISKPQVMKKLYEKTFLWIYECEKIFNNEDLTGYGRTRIYDFLAERYFSFWFVKYAKIKTLPFVFLELKNNEK